MHVVTCRKVLEKSVTAEIEKTLKTYRLKLRFQRRINILQGALEIAASLEHNIRRMLNVLDPTKEYKSNEECW